MEPPQLLLVDDDVNSVHMMKCILEEEGYNVYEAFTGRSAVRRVEPGRYSAVLLDFMLPDIKGDLVADLIRLSDPELAIVLLTGYKQAIDAETQKKFDDILEKPAHPESVLSAIRGAVCQKAVAVEN